ncbi:MAG: sulfite exporter TauE/SafE family protein [Desulfobulbales bacterium]|nr:sulfite exporter TauE/SafE family protein [Desulfobulbales bacterium]
MNEPLITMAFLTGLLGSGHCIGMCGGLVAALSLSGTGRQGGVAFQLLYNIGRITTYGGIGWLVGWLGSAFAYANTLAGLTRALLIGSDLFVIIIGLGSAGLFAFLRVNFMQLEFPGPVQRLTGMVARLKKLPPALAALPLGLIMGFLPCGFLYAMIIAAGQSAKPSTGALMMLSFGLGTLPALFLFGSTAHWLTAKKRTLMLRWAGVMVALIGTYNLYRHLVLAQCCPPFLSFS